MGGTQEIYSVLEDMQVLISISVLRNSEIGLRPVESDDWTTGLVG